MKKYNLFLSVFLIMHIFFWCFSIPYNLAVNIILCILIIFTVITIILSCLDIQNKGLIDGKSNKFLIFPIVCFGISLILSLFTEIRINSGDFKYSDCPEVIVSYLIISIVISLVANTIHRRLFVSHKYIAVFIDIGLAINILLLIVRSILVLFGIYWVENTEFIYAR